MTNIWQTRSSKSL